MAKRDDSVLLPVEQLHKILDYDADSGVFTWNHREDWSKRLNSRYAGKTTGSIDTLGYLSIGVEKLNGMVTDWRGQCTTANGHKKQLTTSTVIQATTGL